MTRIVALSDTHGRHEGVTIPDGDLLIFAGDMTVWGNIDQLRSFDEWLDRLPHRHKLVIAGNHDKCFIDVPTLRLESTRMLFGEHVWIEGLLIHGSPCARRFGTPWFTLGSAKEARAEWAKIPAGVDVLVTHGPPQGILDIDERITGTKAQGCPILRDAVEALRPRVHIFGHIHRNAGAARNQHTRFYNVSIASDSEHDEMNNHPVVIDI